MAQTVIIEVNDGDPISETTASQCKSIIEHFSNGNTSGTFRVEVQTDEPLPVTLGVDHLQGIVENTSESTDGGDGSEPSTDATEAPRLNPDTRRWTLASVLYHSDTAIEASEIVSLSGEQGWEMTQTQASAELYGMFQDGLAERDGSPYEYELTEFGASLLENRAQEEETKIKPDPF